MGRLAVNLLIFGALLVTTGIAHATDNPTLNLDMVPANLANQQPGELIMTIESDAQLSNVSLAITVPPCISSNPPSVTLPVFSRKVVRTAVIIGHECESSGQKMPIIVELKQGGASPQVLASQTLTFTYAKELTLLVYLILGCVGVIVGYWLRLLVKTLAVVSATAEDSKKLSAAEVRPPEELKKFVFRYPVLTDFLVTLLLGILAMLYLAHSGKPPDAAIQWPGAVTLGASLGVLTNSELFTRLGKP